MIPHICRKTLQRPQTPETYQNPLQRLVIHKYTPVQRIFQEYSPISHFPELSTTKGYNFLIFYPNLMIPVPKIF
jgi:hypothetical protein